MRYPWHPRTHALHLSDRNLKVIQVIVCRLFNIVICVPVEFNILFLAVSQDLSLTPSFLWCLVLVLSLLPFGFLPLNCLLMCSTCVWVWFCCHMFQSFGSFSWRSFVLMPFGSVEAFTLPITWCWHARICWIYRGQCPSSTKAKRFFPITSNLMRSHGFFSSMSSPHSRSFIGLHICFIWQHWQRKRCQVFAPLVAALALFVWINSFSMRVLLPYCHCTDTSVPTLQKWNSLT